MQRPRLLVLAAIIAVSASCGGSSYPTGGGGGGGGGACTGTDLNVAVCDTKFAPNISNVAVNATVTWTWKGVNTHNVTWLTGPVAKTNSSTVTTGTFNQTFGTAGAYTYECSIHHFTGTINVN